MKDLWDKTLELFRRHLVLWVPCSIAGISILIMGKVEKAEIHWVRRFFTTQHSALGGEVVSRDLAGMQHRVMMVVYPLGFLKQFLVVSVCVVALVWTKNVIQDILDERRPNMIAALRGVLSRSRGVVVFTLKYMAMLAIFGAVAMALVSSPLTAGRFQDSRLLTGFIYASGLLWEAVAAWLLLPSAIRLLGATEDSISTETRRSGTICAVAAAACTPALEFLVAKAESALILDTPWEGYAVSLVNTVVIGLPQVLLFIALSLLALQGSVVEIPNAEITSA